MALEEQTKGKLLTNVNAVSAVMAERAASTTSSEVSALRHAPRMGGGCLLVSRGRFRGSHTGLCI